MSRVLRRQRRKLEAIGEVFTPTRPISTYTLFAGRYDKVVKVRSAIRQAGQHVVIYGERGVGKTSLANVLAAYLKRGVGLQVAAVNCTVGITFSQLWREVFQYLSLSKIRPGGGFVSSERVRKGTLKDELPPLDPLTPENIRYCLEGYSAEVVIILDEVDRIRNRETIAGIADTIKTLSDHDVRATIVLIGVADSVDELVAEHQSIQRALVQVLMPRMSSFELLQALDKGLGQLQMTIDSAARNIIVSLAQGLPHYVHLLAKHAALAAAKSGDHIAMSHLRLALSSALEDAQETIQSEYLRATRGNPGSPFAQVLLACSLAKDDELGYFATADLSGPITGRTLSRTLAAFCDEKRGAILQKTGLKRQYRYRFANPLMEPFILMRGLDEGAVSEEDLATLDLRDELLQRTFYSLDELFVDEDAVGDDEDEPEDPEPS